MKIYFAGSIRGGRGDAQLYGAMIELMKREGHSVLTEHVGAPSLGAMGERGLSDGEIYARDMAWLRESDLVIAECSTPSLGVGYELAMAEFLGKRAHIFFNTSRGKLSAMLGGCPRFTVHLYSDGDELLSLLRAILQQNG